MTHNDPQWADAQRARLQIELDKCYHRETVAGWLLMFALLTVFWVGVFYWWTS
jgi:hypothetical protein